MEKQRLDKVIASTGKFSRREVKLLVRQGRVLVDGFPARSAEDKIDPEQVEIVVNGEVLTYRKFTWIMLNKPAGYLSATEDGLQPDSEKLAARMAAASGTQVSYRVADGLYHDYILDVELQESEDAIDQIAAFLRQS